MLLPLGTCWHCQAVLKTSSWFMIIGFTTEKYNKWVLFRCTVVQVFATMWTVEPKINACFNSSTRGLFLTCTEGIFFFHIVYTSYMLKYLGHAWIHDVKRENPLLGMVALRTWQLISILAGPLLKANCPIWDFPSVALFPTALFPANTISIYIQTSLTLLILFLSGTASLWPQK
jgi:hypothetical protein